MSSKGGVQNTEPTTYNNMVSRSTDKSSLAIIYCVPLKHALDLVPLPEHPEVSQAVENIVDRIQAMHKRR